MWIGWIWGRGGGVEDDMTPDSEQDIKSRFHKSRMHSQQHSNNDDVCMTQGGGGGYGGRGGGVEDDMTQTVNFRTSS